MDRPGLVFTTDVNGTTTPDNTFAELVRPDGHHGEMAALMADYTTGRRPFAEVLPAMAELAADVSRATVEGYAHVMPLFPGAAEGLAQLAASQTLRVSAALSTTGFAGLMALVNKARHGGLLGVAASPVLVGHLTEEETACLLQPILREDDKTKVLDSLVKQSAPAPGMVFHVGDTLGDFPAITHAAGLGGMGVAFSPNPELLARIGGLPRDVRGRVAVLRFAPGETPDYNQVLDVVRDAVWRQLRCEW